MHAVLSSVVQLWWRAGGSVVAALAFDCQLEAANDAGTYGIKREVLALILGSMKSDNYSGPCSSTVREVRTAQERGR